MKLTSLISEAKINNRIKELAKDIVCRRSLNAYIEDIVLVCVLNGACQFSIKLCEEVKKEIKKQNLLNNVEMDYISISSYRGIDRGELALNKDILLDVENKTVIIIEDIADTRRTLKYVKDHLIQFKPSKLEVCTLLNKPSRLEVKVVLDYVGFDIEDKFVVGYGMDYKGKFRTLNYIAELEL